MEFESIIEDEQKKIDVEEPKTDEEGEKQSETESLRDMFSADGTDADEVTVYFVMKRLMDKYKDFCDECELLWRVPELPATLRQRLIALDGLNQDRYQKMYLLVKKYANDMQNIYIRNPKKTQEEQ